MATSWVISHSTSVMARACGVASLTRHSTAKGLLMARNGTNDDVALRDLMMLSRQSGKPLALVAAELLAAARPFEN